VHTLSLQTVLDGHGQRLPLYVALQTALEVTKAVEAAHAHGRVAGTLDATSLAPDASGHLALQPGRGARVAPELVSGAAPDVTSDLYALAVALYQLFTGVTPAQARGQLVIPTIHAVPLPTLLNPAIDDAVEEMMMALLERDPAERPWAASAVREVLERVMDDLAVEPDARAVAALFAPAAPPPQQQAAAPQPKRAQHLWVVDEDEDDDDVADAVEWREPLRFDAWAAAAAGLVVVAATLIGIVM